MSRRGSIALLLTLTLSTSAAAYLKLGREVNSGAVVGIKWTDMPIRYFITNRDVPGVSASQLQNAVTRAFATWTAAPGVEISSEFAGFVSNEPGSGDSISVIGFRSRPELDRVLGAASFETDDVTGEILASDIFFNSTFTWSVAAAGDSARFDVESISLHEIGHLLGLGHSGLGETEERADGGRSVLGKRAVMFPIAYPRGNIEDRTLEADDRAGIADIYGTERNSSFGAISGRVTLNGQGIFGAHVTAFNQKTGDFVGGFSLNDRGNFVIGGLAPGLYVVRVEPLDDADLDSFFSDEADVNIDFRPAYFSKLVAVPAGGTSGAIEIKVQGK
jgi:hypothetical protein